MKLCVIPARGGSKRIPRKNIRYFCGRPMIAWSIAAANASGCFDRVLVSTDDEETARIAREHGAEAPFTRPAALADDHAGTVAVIRHAVEFERDQGRPAQLVCCLYATAPLIHADDIRRGLHELQSNECDYAFSVARFASPIQRALCLNARGRVEMVEPECLEVRSQDLKERFHDAGQFYWGRADAWLAGKSIFTADAVPVILPTHRVQDIDTEEDWIRAERMFQALHTSTGNGKY